MNFLPTEMCDSDSDYFVDQLIREYDGGVMPLPDIESEPHLLISRVRKHYMEYIIKLLSVNYENNQRLLNKNIYLPSAIWRCAKNMERKAAQTCMVVQLYRKHIVAEIQELKNDTKKGKLNKKLYECLHKPPQNEKQLQTTLDKSETCNCQCNCHSLKKRRKVSETSNVFKNLQQPCEPFSINEDPKTTAVDQNIPVLKHKASEPDPQLKILSLLDTQNKTSNNFSPKPSVRMSVESQDSDDLMVQLEKLFQADPNDDDLFDGALCDTSDSCSFFEDNTKKGQNENSEGSDVQSVKKQDTLIENHAAQIKSLDERLASLTGLLVNHTDSNNSQQKIETIKNKKGGSSKWLCEEYFLKSRLFEVLDQIGDCNRKKLVRIKEILLELFGDDSDDESVVSPLEETPEFIISCKERIAPWVVQLLTPCYIKGRIRGKALFKALAKHLIRLIYQCSRYPHEHEVRSFVSDFLENHKMIRCEADFKQFRIENI